MLKNAGCNESAIFLDLATHYALRLLHYFLHSVQYIVERRFKVVGPLASSALKHSLIEQVQESSSVCTPLKTGTI